MIEKFYSGRQARKWDKAFAVLLFLLCFLLAHAYTYINTVRRRAGLEDLPGGLSKEAFVEALLQERSWELFAEGDRWYDLTRTGQFLTLVPAATNDLFPVRARQAKHKYFPIPQLEINANTKLVQNPDRE